MEKNYKITSDGFIWLIVTDKAKEIFNSGLFALYNLYEDESESLIETHEQLIEALEMGNEIGIEVGQIDPQLNKRRIDEVLEGAKQLLLNEFNYNGLILDDIDELLSK